MANDTRQTEYTGLTAVCGHMVNVRLERNPEIAADMIAPFRGRDCGRSNCPVAQASKASRLPTRGILWADVNGGR
jgi:hypothetical protein